MTARAILLALAAALLAGGCFVGKVYSKVGKTYGKVYSKVLPTLPRGSDGGTGESPPGWDRPDALVTSAPPQQRQLFIQYDDEPEAPADETPVTHRSSSASSSSSHTTYTHTVQRAPSYPSEPFIAMWPASRGSDARVCRVFTDSTDNKAACMAECRSKLIGEPGSCTCMTEDSCPTHTRVVR